MVWVLAAVAVLLAGRQVVDVVRFAAGPDATVDLRVYRDAVRAWAGGRPVYDLRFTEARLPYTYPPFGLLFLGWTGLLAARAAAVVVTLVSVAALVVAGGVVTRRLGASWRVTVLAVAAAFQLEPVVSTFQFGQVNLVLLVVVVLDLLVVPPRWRGVLTGVATAVKLTPGVFLLHLLLARDRRGAVRVVAAAAAATLLGVLVAPGSSWRFWTDSLFDPDRTGHTVFAGNQSLAGLVARALGPAGPTGPVTLALDVLALVAAVVAVRRLAPGDRVGAFGLVALLGLLVSPVSWNHHWVWALPVLAWALRSGRPAVLRGLAAALVAALVVAPEWWFPFNANREFGWSAWQVVVGDASVLLGAALLAAAALVRHRPRPGEPAGAPGSSMRSRPAAFAE